MNRVLSIALLLITILQLFAEKMVYSQDRQWHIKGQVATDARKPLGFATISILDKTGKEIVKTIGDTSGHFILYASLKGTYQLTVTHTGYTSYRSAFFTSGDKNFGVVSLSLSNGALAEVSVTAAQKILELDANAIVFNVSKSIQAQGVSAFEALKRAPGVYIDNDNTITLQGKQGSLVLLDGKQTYLSGNELVDLLKSMPSSGIKSIEIINNPSAKYDAAGSAGIINIKTVRSQVKGLSGTVTTGFTYGISPKQNEDVSFNYRKNKWNVFGSYNHFIGHYTYLYGSDRIQKNKTYFSLTDDTDKRQKMGTRFGVDYSPDKKQTFGLLVTGNFLFGGGITRTKTIIGNESAPGVDQVLDAVNDYYFQQTNRYNVNVNYKFEDSLGRILNIDVDYGSFTKNNSNLQSNNYSNNQQAILTQNLYRSLNGIDIDLRALKVDYTTPLWKGIAESGMKYSGITSDNGARFFHVLGSKDSTDDRRTNTFRFTERITSSYVNYKRTFGKWALQGGLRLEISHSDGALYFKHYGVDSTQHISRQFTNVFPSFSISIKPGEGHNLSLAYSRRIDRPAYQDLNPFIYLLDELSFWQGNPFLMPQLSSRISLQYVYRNKTVLGVNYSNTQQYSTRITDTLDANKIVMVPRNLGTQKNLSLTLTQMLSPAKWWEIIFNGTLYQVHNLIAFDQFKNFNLKQVAGRMNLQQVFKLPCQFTGELSASYVTKRLVGANEVSQPVSQVDLGLQKNIWKNKATLRLVIADIYKGSRSNSLQRFDGFYLRNYGYFETRMLRFNFTYKFADLSVKVPRTRNSALENENGRIK